MGEIADMMLDGTLDSITGEYLGPGPGHPRTMERSADADRKAETKRKARQRRRARQRAKAAAEKQ